MRETEGMKAREIRSIRRIRPVMKFLKFLNKGIGKRRLAAYVFTV